MANEIITGRAGTQTIVSDSYAPFGEFQVGPPIVQEDPSKWHAARIDQDGVCRRYGGVTVEALFDWQQFGFPKPARTSQISAFASWRVRTVHEWDVQKLDQWDAKVRELAAALPTQK